jgi:hypothetical protein
MSKFESSQVSQAVLRSAGLPKRRGNGPESRLFVHSILSPDSGFTDPGLEIAESLWPVREYSRFAEIIGGDRCDHHCVASQAVSAPRGVDLRNGGNALQWRAFATCEAGTLNRILIENEASGSHVRAAPGVRRAEVCLLGAPFHGILGNARGSAWVAKRGYATVAYIRR